MSSEKIRQKFLDFFKSKGHVIIPSAPLLPENDPTVLFTTAGMHPLVPFLLGQAHPAGKRLANFQKCLRTNDIDEVGDNSHNTFFEMLGNWSLGDYFKKESINFSWEFLTSPQWLGLDKNHLAATCFAGDENAPKDDEAAQIWQEVGLSNDRIAFLSKKDNWWGPAGQTGPCGPDSEIFYWTDDRNPAPTKFDPSDNRWVEIWNNVFMQYNKNIAGKYEPLIQKNVDTGMGLERLSMVMQNKDNVFDTDLFKDIMTTIQQSSIKEDQRATRIIADHLRTAIFLLGEKLSPSNLGQGYVLRRIIRRSIRYIKTLEIADAKNLINNIVDIVTRDYGLFYPELKNNQQFILEELTKEHERFAVVLEKGIKEFNKYSADLKNNDKIKEKILSGRLAFKLYDTYGFPIEMTQELAAEQGIVVDLKSYQEAYKKHQELSREASEGKFKGGLADHSEITTAYHTTTHLLHAALRKVLGAHVEQRGSNITAERLRFDFSHPDKMTLEQIKQIEDIVNQTINDKLIVTREEMSLDKALASGAIGLFADKYGDKVSVYTIFNSGTKEIYSKEICGGPHVTSGNQLGHFKILKEESSSAGVRRIKAVLENNL